MKRSYNPFFNLLLLLLLCLVACTVGAEEDEQFDEELVVTATKISQEISEAPGLVQTIHKETIVADQNKSVAELLIDEGFTISTNGGESSLATIRLDGSSAEQTLIMIDGVPVHGGTMGTVDLSYLPLAGTEKIEVVKGPLSALYGANALGGVVNIIPNLTGKPEQSFNFGGGSFGSGHASFQLSRERWGLVIGGNRTDGHRRHSATDRYDLTTQFNLIKHGNDFLKFYGGYRVKNAQIPSHQVWLSYGDQEDRNFFINLSGKKEFNLNSLEAKLFYQTWDNFYDTLNEDLIVTEQDRHFSTRLGTDLTFLHESETHRLLAGFAFNYDTSDSTATGVHQRQEIGLYLQDLWDLNDYLLLHSGVRLDKVDHYQAAFSPRLGLTWFISDQFNLGVNYGTAFREPAMNDMYGKWGGNPDLKPEKGQKMELTGHWRKAQFSIAANIFQSYLREGIIWSDPDGDGTFLPENVERLNTSGVNVNSEYDWGPIVTGLGYTYLKQIGWDPLHKEFTRALNFFGQHRLNLKVQTDLGKLRINTGCQVVATRRDERFPEGNMPDYLLFSAGLYYQISNNCILNLDLENITDTVYEIQPGYPMPGRNFKLNLICRY